MVNDQKGLETDKKVELVRSFGVPVVVMHSLTVPTDRNINLDTKVDVISQLKIWIEKKVNYLVDRGIKKESIIFDPGICHTKWHPGMPRICIIYSINSKRSYGVCHYL